MIRLKFMLCARGIVRDAQTNNLSLFEILEELTPESFPTVIPEFAIAAVLQRGVDDAEQVECSLRIILAGEELFARGLSVSFQNKMVHRNIIRIGGLPLQRPGTLAVSFRCDQDKADLGTYEITINPPRQPGVQIIQETPSSEHHSQQEAGIGPSQPGLE